MAAGQEQVDQMTNFVTQLLDLSRLRAGSVTMNMRTLPAAPFFSSVARGFEGVAERKGIQYEIKVAEDLPERILADPDRLREVVNNLLGNAFKFTGASGRVGFAAEAEDPGWLRVTVSDTGPGIPSEEIPFIFDRYYRSPQAPSPVGTGLGLTVCKRLVEAQGGRIWARLREEGGLEIAFTLAPARLAAPEPVVAAPGPAVTPGAPPALEITKPPEVPGEEPASAVPG